MTIRSGRLCRKSGKIASDGAKSSVADVFRMLVEDRRKREEELAEELRRREEQMTEERESTKGKRRRRGWNDVAVGGIAEVGSGK